MNGETKMKNAALKALAVIGFSASALAVMNHSASAATSAADMTVTASVGDSCTISTATMAFGVYNPVTTHSATGIDLPGEGTITINCTQGDVVTIGLGNGLQPSGAQRQLAAG